jgi:hypothetical protein
MEKRTYIETADRSGSSFVHVENAHFCAFRLPAHNNQIFGIGSNLRVLGAESQRLQVYLSAVSSK